VTGGTALLAGFKSPKRGQSARTPYAWRVWDLRGGIIMRRILMGAAAALALAACGQMGSGGGAPMPQQKPASSAEPVLNAPTQLNGGSAAQQANISSEQDQQLRQLVSGYLNNYQQNLGQGMGAAAGFSDEITSLQPGHDYRWQVNLQGGTQYRIVGACDNECSNVDIELIDANGGVVASDTAPDDKPVVNFTPASNGQYIVRVILQACSVGPCYVGARVLTPGGGAMLSK
jgi:hypothetical protein